MKADDQTDLEKEPENRRILIIDDNQTIHDDIAKVLRLRNDPPPGPASESWRKFFAAAEPLAMDPPPPTYEISSAHQGDQGVTLARAAASQGRPYALAFVDGRMPPGIDGIETCRLLWEHVPDLQIVLCTAYADYNWEDIRRVLGARQDLIILHKPFDIIEVQQLADTLTTRWNEQRRTRRIIDDLRHLIDAAPEPLEPEEPIRAVPNEAETAHAVPRLSTEHLPAIAIRQMIAYLAKAEEAAADIERKTRLSRTTLLGKLVPLLRQHRAQLGLFGEKLPPVLAQLAGQLEEERTAHLTAARAVRHQIALAQAALGVAPPPPPALRTNGLIKA